MPLFERIGEALIRARKMAGFKSQTKAAKAAGVDQAQLSGWEKQMTEIRLGNLSKLLEAWGFSVRDFGQLVDELNGGRSQAFERLSELELDLAASANRDDEFLWRQLEELRAELGLPKKDKESYDLQVRDRPDPQVAAQIIEELRGELQALRAKYDNVQKYLGGVISSAMAEADKGNLSETTLISIMRSGGSRAPAENGGDKSA